MQEELDDRDLMRTAPMLMRTGKMQPFSVPENYFVELAEVTAARVRLESVLNPYDGLTVPENYFETSRENLKALAVIVAADTQPVPLSVPESYFEEAQSAILEAVHKPQAHVKRLWPSLLKFSAAASVILIAGLTYFLKPEDKPATVEIPRNVAAQHSTLVADQYLYDIDESTIVDHLQQSEAAMVHVSPTAEEVENYILNHYTQNDLTSAL